MTPATLSAAQARALREKLGYTLEVMAARVGIGMAMLHEIETGRTRITVVVANAMQWVARTGGPEIPAQCAPCGGVGTVRAGERSGGPHRRRVKCTACAGAGFAGVERVVL